MQGYNIGMNLPPIPFTQEIPLFPLPNCVLFPGTVQPLHIFEPRYQAMMQAALRETGTCTGGGSCGGVLALALLRPGWEKDYYGSPPVYKCLCAGRIVAHERLPDGTYNLLLQGASRARVISERLCAGEWGAYRLAMLEEIPEVPADAEEQCSQRQMLRRLFETTALKDLTITPALAALFEDAVTSSRLVDALGFTLVQNVEAKQRLLEESDAGVRGQLLLRELMALARRLEATAVKQAKGGRCWPPEMGEN
jgi:uncharacterized protein